MRSSFQHRLHDHEVVPPPAAWNSIASRLDNEFNPSDSLVSDRLDRYTLQPPAHVWENISGELSSAGMATERKKARVIPIVYRRLAAAVVLAAVLSAAAMYFLDFDSNRPVLTSQQGIVRETVKPPADTPQRSELQASPQQHDAASNSANAHEPRQQGALPRQRAYQPIASRAGASAAASEPSYTHVIQEAHVTTPQTHPVTDEPIMVSAPPIRDGNGNIIMDVDVISKPGQQYITVTSPNGNPTRISNKFLNCLRYINANLSASEMDSDARECKEQFEAWRRKLLSDGSFMPAADNFFDIFELKEMIQD